MLSVLASLLICPLLVLNTCSDYHDDDGYSASDGDCDDANAAVYPDAVEVYDSLGINCDDYIDEANVCTPENLATPLKPSSTQSFADSVAFLFAGEYPFPRRVEAGVFDATLTVVLHGSVATTDAQLVKDVRITLPDHPEWGYTFSREDGRYDLVVDGGGVLTVRLEHPSFLPVQRTVLREAQQFFTLPEVVLTPPEAWSEELELGVGPEYDSRLQYAS